MEELRRRAVSSVLVERNPRIHMASPMRIVARCCVTQFDPAGQQLFQAPPLKVASVPKMYVLVLVAAGLRTLIWSLSLRRIPAETDCPSWLLQNSPRRGAFGPASAARGGSAENCFRRSANRSYLHPDLRA
jgi:hypothetical protein